MTATADRPPAEAVELIQRWCIQMVPETNELLYRVEAKARGNRVTIVERHYLGSMPKNPFTGELLPDDWSAGPIAQLRYLPIAGRELAWSLYWMRQTGRWEYYAGHGTAGSPEPLLAEIERDPDGVFFG
ncbi:DUF3024 domain-containing protein [Jatrophihabitans telluris]|uniref:DUF3024 domain-containing protein n=1 Tax=Jatrophihabitans telluris TaxID=2038343 RepID=A0ABY4QXI8_9ACTN|nr:DUF3024 domain-containing protein [Jatrophihabitans telluris]UQX88255.1 DUF3024 domain-containing protein [Jatrophihabitans telluris]